MHRVLLAIVVAAMVLALPAAGSAQTYLVPEIGVDFGGSAGKCPSLLNDCQEKRANYGVAFGHLAAGIFGFEGDIGYAPDFFGESSSFGTNAVLTAMGNLVVGIPAGPVRPFVTGGIGLIRTRLDLLLTPSSENFSANNFGYNFGGGVMIFLPAHLGIRGDIKYFRSASDVSIFGISLANSAISYTRVSVGLVIH